MTPGWIPKHQKKIKRTSEILLNMTLHYPRNSPKSPRRLTMINTNVNETTNILKDATKCCLKAANNVEKIGKTGTEQSRGSF